MSMKHRFTGEPLDISAAEFNTVISAANDRRTLARPHQAPAPQAMPYDVALAVNVGNKTIKPYEPIYIVGTYSDGNFGGVPGLARPASPGILSLFENPNELQLQLQSITAQQPPEIRPPHRSGTSDAKSWFEERSSAEAAAKFSALSAWQKRPVLLVASCASKQQWPRGSSAASQAGTYGEQQPPIMFHCPIAISLDNFAGRTARNAGGFTPGKVVTSGIVACRITGPPRYTNPGGQATYATPSNYAHLATGPTGPAEVLADPHAYQSYTPPTAPDFPGDRAHAIAGGAGDEGFDAGIPSSSSRTQPDPDGGRIALVRLGPTPPRQLVAFKLYTRHSESQARATRHAWQFNPWGNVDQANRAKAWVLSPAGNHAELYSHRLEKKSPSPDTMQPIGECGVIDPAGLFPNAFPGAVGYGYIEPTYTPERHPTGSRAGRPRPTTWRPTIIATSLQQYATSGYGYLNWSEFDRWQAGSIRNHNSDDRRTGGQSKAGAMFRSYRATSVLVTHFEAAGAGSSAAVDVPFVLSKYSFNGTAERASMPPSANRFQRAQIYTGFVPRVHLREAVAPGTNDKNKTLPQNRTVGWDISQAGDNYPRQSPAGPVDGWPAEPSSPSTAGLPFPVWGPDVYRCRFVYQPGSGQNFYDHGGELNNTSDHAAFIAVDNAEYQTTEGNWHRQNLPEGFSQHKGFQKRVGVKPLIWQTPILNPFNWVVTNWEPLPDERFSPWHHTHEGDGTTFSGDATVPHKNNPHYATIDDVHHLIEQHMDDENAHHDETHTH